MDKENNLNLKTRISNMILASELSIMDDYLVTVENGRWRTIIATVDGIPMANITIDTKAFPVINIFGSVHG